MINLTHSEKTAIVNAIENYINNIVLTAVEAKDLSEVLKKIKSTL